MLTFHQLAALHLIGLIFTMQRAHVLPQSQLTSSIFSYQLTNNRIGVAEIVGLVDRGGALEGAAGVAKYAARSPFFRRAISGCGNTICQCVFSGLSG